MFRRFGKMGASASSTSNSTAPPVTKYVNVDCETADSTFNPDSGDKLYDCEDAENNATDKILNGGKS